MGELALAVRPRASPSLEFPADLQCQPLCVPDLCHVHCHFVPDGRARLSQLRIRQMRLYLRAIKDTGTTGEKKRGKDMGVRQFLCGAAEAWDSPTTCVPSQESIIALLLSLSTRARAASSHRTLPSNLFLSGSLKYSCQSLRRQSSTQLSDETNGKTHY